MSEYRHHESPVRTNIIQWTRNEVIYIVARKTNQKNHRVLPELRRTKCRWEFSFQCMKKQNYWALFIFLFRLPSQPAWKPNRKYYFLYDSSILARWTSLLYHKFRYELLEYNKKRVCFHPRRHIPNNKWRWERENGELKRSDEISTDLTKPHCAMIWLCVESEIERESNWNSKLANEFVCWQWLHLLTYKSSADLLWEFQMKRKENEIFGENGMKEKNFHFQHCASRRWPLVAKFALKFMFDSLCNHYRCAASSRVIRSKYFEMSKLSILMTHLLVLCPFRSEEEKTHVFTMKVNFSILLHTNDHKISLFQSNIDEL